MFKRTADGRTPNEVLKEHNKTVRENLKEKKCAEIQEKAQKAAQEAAEAAQADIDAIEQAEQNEIERQENRQIFWKETKKTLAVFGLGMFSGAGLFHHFNGINQAPAPQISNSAPAPAPAARTTMTSLISQFSPQNDCPSTTGSSNPTGNENLQYGAYTTCFTAQAQERLAERQMGKQFSVVTTGHATHPFALRTTDPSCQKEVCYVPQ